MTRNRRFLALLLCTLAVSWGGAFAGDGDVRLYLDPSVVELGPGERAVVAVRVGNVPAAGLAAFQLELAFDPQRLELVDPNAAFPSVPAFAPLGGSPVCAVVRQQSRCPDPRWMLTRSGRQAVGTTAFDPAAGTVTIAYGSSGNAPPVEGDGTLALIEVRGRAKVRAPLKIVDAILADADDPPNRFRWERSKR